MCVMTSTSNAIFCTWNIQVPSRFEQVSLLQCSVQASGSTPSSQVDCKPDVYNAIRIGFRH